MFVYSRTIQAFTRRLKHRAFEILSQEMQVQIGKSRFEYQGRLYPLSLVVFEHPTKLGFFDHAFYTIGINKIFLTRGPSEQLDHLLRHELGHYLQFIIYGTEVKPHGVEYHDLCRRFGWGPEVFHATLNREDLDQEQQNDARSQVLAKVHKLFKLSESLNPHEAALATLRANELLIKHNLQDLDLDSGEDSEVCRLAVLEFKRKDAKTDAILTILCQFQVEAIYAVGTGHTKLEVIGSRLNVEAADYLAKFLWNEFERLLKIERRQHPELKGLRARNSFFHGIQEGYVKKLKVQKAQSQSSRELALLENQLKEQVALVYPRLSQVRRGLSFDSKARERGQVTGQGLSLRAGLNFGKKLLRLGYQPQK